MLMNASAENRFDLTSAWKEVGSKAHPDMEGRLKHLIDIIERPEELEVILHDVAEMNPEAREKIVELMSDVRQAINGLCRQKDVSVPEQIKKTLEAQVRTAFLNTRKTVAKTLHPELNIYANNHLSIAAYGQALRNSDLEVSEEDMRPISDALYKGLETTDSEQGTKIETQTTVVDTQKKGPRKLTAEDWAKVGGKGKAEDSREAASDTITKYFNRR